MSTPKVGQTWMLNDAQGVPRFIFLLLTMSSQVAFKALILWTLKEYPQSRLVAGNEWTVFVDQLKCNGSLLS